MLVSDASAIRAARRGGVSVPVIACGVAVVLAIGLTAWSGGGFDASSQAWLLILGGVALLLAGAADTREALAIARSPLAVTLAALAAASALSALWTIESSQTAVRAGLTVSGYLAVFVASGTLSRAAGARPIAMMIVALALLEGLLGLGAVWSRELPRAEVIGGVWRPGGTFEYPPALAVLQTCAIPIIASMFDRRGGWVVPGLLAALCAGAVMSLAEDRLALALSAVFLLAMVAAPRRVGVSRLASAVTAALVIAAAVIAPATRPAAASQRGGGSHPGAATGTGDLLHGRAHEISAALETWLDRPVLGAGAGAYLSASARHQGRSAVLYAHDLPLELAAELGVVGVLLGVALYVTCGGLAAGVRFDPGAVLMAAPVIAFLASNLIDWTWHLAALAAVWAAACGALTGARRNGPPSRIVPGRR